MRFRMVHGASSAARRLRVHERVRRLRWMALPALGLLAAVGLLSGPDSPSQADIIAPGSGRVVFADNGDLTPQWAVYDGASFGSSQDTVASLGTFVTMRGADAHTRDEVTVVGIKADGGILAMQWDGSVWAEVSLGSLGSSSASDVAGFDVAYEHLSGDALMVWNTTATNSLSYSVWNGTVWSGPATLGLPGWATGEPVHMKLAASPVTDESSASKRLIVRFVVQLSSGPKVCAKIRLVAPWAAIWL